MTHPHAALIDRFYRAFAALDGEAMASCYAPDVRFSDPVFPDLRGSARAGGMWRMLCESAPDLRVEHSGVEADDAAGAARWEAWYTFGPTGRRVHNVIDARFRFADGRIVEHVDRFDLHRWSRQALGLVGLLLGGTPLLRRQLRARAGAELERYLSSRRAP